MPRRHPRAAALALILAAVTTIGAITGCGATQEPPAPSPTPYDPVFPKGATVAFFGDSQATIMLRPDRTPPWLAEYMTPVDKSIEGCGILLGKVRSRSGESRNLATDFRCKDWQSVW